MRLILSVLLLSTFSPTAHAYSCQDCYNGVFASCPEDPNDPRTQLPQCKACLRSCSDTPAPLLFQPAASSCAYEEPESCINAGCRWFCSRMTDSCLCTR